MTYVRPKASLKTKTHISTIFGAREKAKKKIAGETAAKKECFELTFAFETFHGAHLKESVSRDVIVTRSWFGRNAQVHRADTSFCQWNIQLDYAHM